MVAAVAITRLDYTASQLRGEAKRADDADAARRMLALALVLEGKPRSEAAISCGMDRQILAIGCIATTPKVWLGCTTKPRRGRSRSSPPSKSAKWPTWSGLDRIWSSMA